MTLLGNKTGKSRFALVLLGAMATAGPASAQDYLGIHLDTMREHNLRLHQQQNASPGRAGKSPASKPKSGKMSPQAEARAPLEYVAPAEGAAQPADDHAAEPAAH